MKATTDSLRLRIGLLELSHASRICRLSNGSQKASLPTVPHFSVSWRERLVAADFGIALAEPDALVMSRDRKSATPRDNVIFELGFFMSRLGRHRTVLLVPKSQEIKLPSDFKGLIPIAYDKGKSGRDSVALGPTIDKISCLIADLRVRASLTEVK